MPVEPRHGGKHFPFERRLLDNRAKNYAGREKRIQAEHDSSRKGINFRAYTGLPKLMARIENTWKLNNKSPAEIVEAQAIMLNRQACEHADHGVKSFFKAPNASQELSLLRTVGVNDIKDPLKRQKIWEYFYNGLVDCVKTYKAIPNHEEIHDMAAKLERYSGLPDSLYKVRAEQWPEINKIVNRLIGQKQDPRQNLMAEVSRVIQRPAEEYQATSHKEVMLSKAWDICTAASIYADILERTNNISWQTAYNEGMLSIYEKIKDKTDLLEAIVELD